jgi:uncharacterized protein (TIGR03437 family)
LMNVASPGIFEAVSAGTVRQAAVLNQDNSPNSPANPAARGSIIQIYAVGAGFVPGAPADGSGITGTLNTPSVPQVLIGACLVDDTACTGDPTGTENVTYSGLDGLPGVWQVNVRIPMNTAPGTQVPIFLGMDGIFSSDPSAGFVMTIAVK